MEKSRLSQSLLTDRHLPGESEALLPRNGPANLDSWRLAVDTAHSNEEFQQLAERLLASSRQAMSESLWALLFERWSEFAPKAMINFAEAIVGHASTKAIQEMAYFAWASRQPETALAKARFCSTAIQHAALEGAVAAQPDKAAAFVLSLPNAQ
jgi:hypothetical protein